MNAQQIIDSCVAILATGKKPTKPDVKPLVDAFYQLAGNGAGGSLHIVLDDGNVGDSSVEFCVEYARQAEDRVGEHLAMVLLRMSKTQRSSM